MILLWTMWGFKHRLCRANSDTISSSGIIFHCVFGSKPRVLYSIYSDQVVQIIFPSEYSRTTCDPDSLGKWLFLSLQLYITSPRRHILSCVTRRCKTPHLFLRIDRADCIAAQVFNELELVVQMQQSLKNRLELMDWCVSPLRRKPMLTLLSCALTPVFLSSQTPASNKRAEKTPSFMCHLCGILWRG